MFMLGYIGSGTSILALITLARQTSLARAKQTAKMDDPKTDPF